MFTGQVELGEGVSADDVQDVEQGEVDGQQDDTQQSDRQHLEPTRYLTTHVCIKGEFRHNLSVQAFTQLLCVNTKF